MISDISTYDHSYLFIGIMVCYYSA